MTLHSLKINALLSRANSSVDGVAPWLTTPNCEQAFSNDKTRLVSWRTAQQQLMRMHWNLGARLLVYSFFNVKVSQDNTSWLCKGQFRQLEKSSVARGNVSRYSLLASISCSYTAWHTDDLVMIRISLGRYRMMLDRRKLYMFELYSATAVIVVLRPLFAGPVIHGSMYQLLARLGRTQRPFSCITTPWPIIVYDLIWQLSMSLHLSSSS